MTTQAPGVDPSVAQRRTARPAPVVGPRLRIEHLAAADVAAKLVLAILLVKVAADPTWAHLDGKAPMARVALYPVCVLALPAFWVVSRRAAAFPWAADLLIAAACLTDVLGNRLDLYDSMESFDDWVHVVDTALVTAASLLVTVPRSASVAAVVEGALAAGLTASLAWELFEYGTFLTRSTEWTSAYSDTIGDLALGWLGAALVAAAFAVAWRHERRGDVP